MAALSPRAIPVARRASALYCATYGSGTPVLLIHGLGDSGAVFQPLLSAFSARHYTIVPDLRGHGFSRRLGNAGSVDRFVSDIENLLDLLDIPPCFVVGHGVGGAVAQQLAHQQPERVRGLVLVSAYARSAGTLREQIEGRFRLPALRLGHAADNARPTQSVSNARTALPFDSRSWLPAVTCPALVVTGAADVVAPPHCARELAHSLPNAQLHIVPGASYSIISTHSMDLRHLILPWLADHEVAG
ncbi:MAG: alpha/beta hydrolase [Blastochloris sp.]|nr:alpha/beta hydrolase [Blastochloris sp.]